MIEAYRQPLGTSPRDFGERILAIKFRMRGGWKKKHRRRRT